MLRENTCLEQTEMDWRSNYTIIPLAAIALKENWFKLFSEHI